MLDAMKGKVVGQIMRSHWLRALWICPQIGYGCEMDNETMDSQRNYVGIQRVLVVTFFLNLLSALVKLAAGIWTGALSLIADGIDTLFDGLTNVIGVIVVRFSSHPPDEDHPYGHRKFETVAALIIAAMLFIVVWELISNAIGRLRNPVEVTVTWPVIGALLLSITFQVGAGLWELRKSRVYGSEILRVDARHALASVGASTAVLLGLLLVSQGYLWADALVTILVAGFIAKIGIDAVVENVPALVDRAPVSPGQIGAVVNSVEGVTSYHRVRSRGPDDDIAVDLHIRVDPKLTMQEANAIADEVRRRLLQLPGVSDVTIHAEAQRHHDGVADVYTATRLAAQELNVTIHEWWLQEDDGQMNICLHAGVDPGLTLEEAHSLVDQLEREVLDRQSQLDAVHTHIELANLDVLPSARVSNSLQQRVEMVVHEVAGTIPELTDLRNVRVRQVEGQLFITADATVDGALSVSEAHELSTQLEEGARNRIVNARDVSIHLEPDENSSTALADA